MEILPDNIRRKQISPDLSAIVKSVYYDYNIRLVQELNLVTGTEWLVFLEDNSIIRIVKVNRDKEMEFIQDIDK